MLAYYENIYRYNVEIYGIENCGDYLYIAKPTEYRLGGSSIIYDNKRTENWDVHAIKLS